MLRTGSGGCNCKVQSKTGAQQNLNESIAFRWPKSRRRKFAQTSRPVICQFTSRVLHPVEIPFPFRTAAEAYRAAFIGFAGSRISSSRSSSCSGSIRRGKVDDAAMLPEQPTQHHLAEPAWSGRRRRRRRQPE